MNNLTEKEFTLQQVLNDEIEFTNPLDTFFILTDCYDKNRERYAEILNNEDVKEREIFLFQCLLLDKKLANLIISYTDKILEDIMNSECIYEQLEALQIEDISRIRTQIFNNNARTSDELNLMMSRYTVTFPIKHIHKIN